MKNLTNLPFLSAMTPQQALPKLKRFKLNSKAGVAASVLLAGVVAFSFGGSALYSSANAQSSANDAFRQLNLFGDVFERVRSLHVEERTDRELIEAAIDGMLSSLDPHSAFLPAEDFKEMQVETRGTFGGLGIEVTMEDGLVKVVSPIDDTPAARAGLKAGDLISTIDGEPVMGLDLDEAVDKMRGRVGEDITITVLRGTTDPFEVTITRDVIKVRSVRHRIEDESIGYLRIASFSGTAYDGLETGIRKIEEEGGDKIKAYILDLRSNPGGLLNQAIAVSDAFLNKGEIVSTRGRNDEDVTRHSAEDGDLIDGKPLIVLVNGGSASASEIVAGALQDHSRALIMGTQTFGKGSVQTIYDMPPYGAVKMTTANYFTPAGTSIQATGITPDLIIEQSKVESLETGSRRKEADLRGALDNPNEDEDVEAQDDEAEDQNADQANEDEAPADESQENDGSGDEEGEKDGEKDGDEADAESEPELVDYQLIRAKDLLKGMFIFDTLQQG